MTPPFPFDAGLRAGIEERLAGFDRVGATDERLRPAAVAVAILGDESGSACFVLTRRAARLRSHGGQWALPGGRLDAGERPDQAALRELEEEVGLERGGGRVLGLLDDYPTRSGFSITPVVVWSPAVGPLAPNPSEVAAVYKVPLADLDRPGVPRLRAIPESDRPIISIPLLGTSVHAPTAAILYQMLEVALRGRSTRVARFDQPVFAWR